MVSGSTNNIVGDTNLLKGSVNNIAGNKNLVMGDENSVQGDQNVIGSNVDFNAIFGASALSNGVLGRLNSAASSYNTANAYTGSANNNAASNSAVVSNQSPSVSSSASTSSSGSQASTSSSSLSSSLSSSNSNTNSNSNNNNSNSYSSSYGSTITSDPFQNLQKDTLSQTTSKSIVVDNSPKASVTVNLKSNTNSCTPLPSITSTTSNKNTNNQCIFGTVVNSMIKPVAQAVVQPVAQNSFNLLSSVSNKLPSLGLSSFGSTLSKGRC